jgi:hypothetical protein
VRPNHALTKEQCKVMEASDDILSRVDHGIGFVTLNRPKAIKWAGVWVWARTRTPGW